MDLPNESTGSVLDRPTAIVGSLLVLLSSEAPTSDIAPLLAAPIGHPIADDDELAWLRDALYGSLAPDGPPVFEYAISNQSCTYLSPSWARVLLFDVTDGLEIKVGKARNVLAAYLAFIQELDDWRFLKVDGPSISVESLPTELHWQRPPSSWSPSLNKETPPFKKGFLPGGGDQ